MQRQELSTPKRDAEQDKSLGDLTTLFDEMSLEAKQEARETTQESPPQDDDTYFAGLTTQLEGLQELLELAHTKEQVLQTRISALTDQLAKSETAKQDQIAALQSELKAQNNASQEDFDRIYQTIHKQFSDSDRRHKVAIKKQHDLLKEAREELLQVKKENAHLQKLPPQKESRSGSSRSALSDGSIFRGSLSDEAQRYHDMYAAMEPRSLTKPGK